MFLSKDKPIAVIGAGNMGAQIAGYLARFGFEVENFDILTPGGISISRRAWENAVKNGTVAHPLDRERITPKVLGDDEECLSDASWIIEAVSEDPEIKAYVYNVIEANRHPDSVVTSNTSGISIAQLFGSRGKSLREHSLGAHFFNPLFWTSLVEVIPHEGTDEALLERFEDFLSRDLQKAVVRCLDTPNFIANRYGVMAMQVGFFFWTPGLSVQDVDEIFTMLTGWTPLKTCDIVGIGLMGPVAANVWNNLTERDDPFRKFFDPKIEKIETLVSLGFTGRKSKAGSGFFARLGKEKYMFDFGTNEYVPAKGSDFRSLATARQEKDPVIKSMTLLSGQDEAGEFARNVFFRMMAYAPFLVEAICHGNPTKLDLAMTCGFNWPLGPMQMAQLGNFEFILNGIESVGCRDMVPMWFHYLGTRKGAKLYENPLQPERWFTERGPKEEPIIQTIPDVHRIIRVQSLFDGGEDVVIYRDKEASVLDLGHNVYQVVFHNPPVNAADEGIFTALHKGMDIAERCNGGLVVGSDDPKAFCAGANVKRMLEWSREGNFKAIGEMIDRFQGVTQRMTYCSVPVITAPHFLILGGGSEIAMAGDAAVVNFIAQWGQPEARLCIPPAAGGCLRLLKRALGGVPYLTMWGPDWNRELTRALIKPVWETIVYSKQSENAVQAGMLGFLRPGIDEIVYQDGLRQAGVLYRAKQKALGMMRSGYRPPTPMIFNLPGEAVAAGFELQANILEAGHFVPKESAQIAAKIAYILCGGDTRLGQQVTEDDILALEKEIFLKQIGTDAARQAMAMIVERRK